MKSKCACMAVASFFLFGCVNPLHILSGSSETIVVKYSATGYSKILVSDGCIATITRGDSFSIFVKINENLEKHLRIVRTNDKVAISLDEGYSYSHLTFKATITMPDLDAITGSDASEINVDGFQSAHSLAIDISDAGELAGTIICGEATLFVSDASKVNLSGNAGNLNCKLNDASTASLKDFFCKDAAVDIQDASELTLTASGTLSGTVNDASEMVYYGNPTLGTILVHDGSTVRRGN
jgi:hypothetical protein